MSGLAYEIVEEILVRLPAKSLVRFNLVCKQWRSLISDPKFVRMHLNHVLLDDDQSNHHHKLFANPCPNFFSREIPLQSPKLYSIDYNEESLKSTKLDFPLQSPRSRCIFGSCNGLLLIGLYEHYYACRFDLILWNPLLRDYNLLPEGSSISGYVRLIGFGYDSCLDDYKVVRVFTQSRHGKSLRDLEQKVEVYTLKTNSWKTIQGGIPYGNLHLDDHIRGTFVNGSIYWVVKYDLEDNLILAFDLIGENFRLVEVPQDGVPCTWQRSLIEVRGCLGLDQIRYDFPKHDMWILKEDENKNKCWTKLMSIPKDFSTLIWPAFLMKNNKVLLSITTSKSSEDNKKLAVYNPRNMTFLKLPVCEISDWWEEIIYVETLVSPLGG